MADTTTPNYGLIKPEPGASDDTWGDKSNANWDSVDSIMKALSLALVPVGGISMFSGDAANLPANWAICDGSNGTPDLRDRFIVGASDTKALGSTGGRNAITEVPAHTHGPGTLAAAAGGAHGHTVNDPGHTHTFTDNGITTTGTANIETGSRTAIRASSEADTTASRQTGITLADAPDHTHTISGEVASAGAASVDITPYYYALAYIRRMS